jgi:RNA polymerase sigma-70 factor (ECF subfamily)
MPEAESISSDWLERVRAHDEAASRELVERLHPLVLRIVRAHRPQRMAEEDLCQEVFMSLFASLAQYRGSVPFDHSVSRVAVNTCIDHLRRHRSRPELRWADLAPDEARALESLHDGHPATSTGDAVATNDLLEKILATLPPEDRLVIQLMALDQRSVKEVCALTGWSAPLVKVRAFRARRKMRRSLELLLKSEKS